MDSVKANPLRRALLLFLGPMTKGVTVLAEHKDANSLIFTHDKDNTNNGERVTGKAVEEDKQ